MREKTKQGVCNFLYTIIYFKVNGVLIWICFRITYWWETEDNVEIVSDPGEVILVQILIWRRSSGEFLLHDRDELSHDLVHLISSKQVCHLLKQIVMSHIMWIMMNLWKFITQSELNLSFYSQFLRRGHCWGIQGKLRLWSPGLWKWMWFLSPGHLLCGTGIWGLPEDWTHCKTWHVARKHHLSNLKLILKN